MVDVLIFAVELQSPVEVQAHSGTSACYDDTLVGAVARMLNRVCVQALPRLILPARRGSRNPNEERGYANKEDK